MDDQYVIDVKNCILKYKVKDIVPAINKAIEAGVSPSVILDQGMIAGMNEIGEGFKNNTIYMPQMLMAAKTMQTGLAVLKPILKGDGASSSAGKAVVGSVLGDVHDIGKNLVTVMLEGVGMEVTDLGADVPTEKFIEFLEANPDTKFIACSSSMTPTRPALQETVTTIKGRKEFDNAVVFVGGATMDQQFSDEIGADIYTADAATASEFAKMIADGAALSDVQVKSRAASDASGAAGESAEAEAKEEVIVRHRHLEPPKIRELKAAGKYDKAPMSIMDNLREWLKHDEGCPDAFLNQYFMDILFDPVMIGSRNMQDEFFQPKPRYVDGWGVTHSIPEGSAGSHPEETDDVLVVKDITKWKEQVRGQAPTVYPEEAWALADQQAAAAKEAGRPIAIGMFPGLFERTHFLLGMKPALEAYYEHPDEMHELIDWVADWECRSLDATMGRYHAPILFHHDDWGTAINSFLDPVTHRDFFLEPYKRVYQHFRDLGGEVVIHHSDSYAANLVPIWIDAGVDIWQGPVSANNIPELIDKYGDRFMFMGGIDNAIIDSPDSTPEMVEAFVRKRIEENGCHSYIPCLTRGLGFSIVPGIYDQVTAAIDKINKEKF